MPSYGSLHVVAEGGGLDAPVRTDAALRRQHGRQDRVVENRLAALLSAQRVDERQPLVLLGLQHAGARVDARLGDHRLGAHEHRRDHHLIADDEAVDDQVMAVDLPAPRLVLRWLAEHADEVDPLAVLGPAPGDLADGVVQPHDVARGAEAARAERLLDQPQRGRTLLVVEIFQQHAVTHQERVDIPPAPPGVRADLERAPAAAGWRRAPPETRSPRGGSARLRPRSSASGKETGDDVAVGGDPLERLADEALSAVAHPAKALANVGRGVLAETGGLLRKPRP